jgi:hypothetical protein
MPSKPLSSPRNETSIATECSFLPCLSRALANQSIIFFTNYFIKILYYNSGTTKYLIMAFIQNSLLLLAEIPAGFLLAGLG